MLTLLFVALCMEGKLLTSLCLNFSSVNGSRDHIFLRELLQVVNELRYPRILEVAGHIESKCKHIFLSLNCLVNVNYLYWKERHPDGPGKIYIFVKIVIFYSLINSQMAMRSKSDLIKGVPRIDLVFESVLFFVKLNQRHYLFKSSGSYYNGVLNVMF